MNIPVIKKLLPLGNKKCKVCSRKYHHSDIKDQGILNRGLYWINCECGNTLAIKENSNEERK